MFIPVSGLISGGKAPETLVETVDASSLTFKIKAENTTGTEDIILTPFHKIHHHYHNVYLNLDYEGDSFEIDFNNVTIDSVEPDGQQDELGHNLKSLKSQQGNVMLDWKSCRSIL